MVAGMLGLRQAGLGRPSSALCRTPWGACPPPLSVEWGHHPTPKAISEARACWAGSVCLGSRCPADKGLKNPDADPGSGTE